MPLLSKEQTSADTALRHKLLAYLPIAQTAESQVCVGWVLEFEDGYWLMNSPATMPYKQHCIAGPFESAEVAYAAWKLLGGEG